VNKAEISENHPLRDFFFEALCDALYLRLGLDPAEDVERYLVDMLTGFLHEDAIYRIRDSAGRRVDSVVEMLAEGDVRLNADSFEREREVHKHVGDFLLFWSGVFPEFLKQLKAPHGRDALVHVVEQGKLSYYVASTFSHEPYSDEAKTFQKLSLQFEAYQQGLSLVRASFEGFRRQGWIDGFEA
jgi:hypothetical protein